MKYTEEFVIQSNAIEGYEGSEFHKGSQHFDQHLEAYHFCLENDLTMESK